MALNFKDMWSHVMLLVSYSTAIFSSGIAVYVLQRWRGIGTLRAHLAGLGNEAEFNKVGRGKPHCPFQSMWLHSVLSLSELHQYCDKSFVQYLLTTQQLVQDTASPAVLQARKLSPRDIQDRMDYIVSAVEDELKQLESWLYRLRIAIGLGMLFSDFMVP